MPDLSIEHDYRAKGYSIICGVDEAGRGPLSGPVVAAACILPEGCEDWGLNDSKKLSEKKRDALAEVNRGPTDSAVYFITLFEKKLAQV